MLPALRSEFFRVYRRRMPRILLLLVAAVVAALYLLLWLSLEGAQDIVAADGDVDEMREMLMLSEVGRGGALPLIYLVATIMGVILGASIIATEYNWGTIRTVLPRTSGRSVFLAAKIVVLLAFALAASFAGVIGALAASAIITPLAGLDADLGAGFIPGIAGTVGLGFVVVLPYMALAFMMGLIARSTAAGVGLGLAVLFLEDPIITLLTGAGGIAERASEFLLTPNVSALLTLVEEGPADASEVIRGFAVLAAYAAVFMVIAFWRFRRRDVIAG